MEKWEKIETYILIATLAIGGIVAILDFVGVLDNIVWLNQRITTLTLLLVSLIATSLLIGTIGYRFLIKVLLPYGAVRTFSSDKEAFDYMVRRIQEATLGVCDITWENPYRATIVFDNSDTERYLRAIEGTSRRIKYREIIMFCGKKPRIEKAIRMIDRAGKYYELSVYEDLPDNSPPRTAFWIIDDEEVILGSTAIRHKDIVGYFRRYYDELWARAIPVKMADSVNTEFVENLRLLL